MRLRSSLGIPSQEDLINYLICNGVWTQRTVVVSRRPLREPCQKHPRKRCRRRGSCAMASRRGGRHGPGACTVEVCGEGGGLRPAAIRGTSQGKHLLRSRGAALPRSGFRRTKEKQRIFVHSLHHYAACVLCGDDFHGSGGLLAWSDGIWSADAGRGLALLVCCDGGRR